MTLARTRLLLGITGVGGTVVVAAAALLFNLPDRWLPADPSMPVLPTVGWALLWPLAWTLMLAPLDLFGGTVAVRHRPAVATWVIGWCRGVAVQFVVLAIAGAALLTLTRALGLLGTVVGVVVAAVVLATLMATLARAGASLPQVPVAASWWRRAGISDAAATLVRSADEAFVGGHAGVLRPHLWAPASWTTLPGEAANALLVRRRLAKDAPRIRGLALAWVWLALGALASALAIALPTSAAGLAAFSMGTTLWSFLGVLVLPTPSRRAVVALDQMAAREVGREAVAEAITALDRWQDDEPSRPAVVEAVFHPVPARDARLRRLAGDPPTASGAWRPARLALPLGLGSWSLLGRAVHCNIGRPALWWFLPGD